MTETGILFLKEKTSDNQNPDFTWFYYIYFGMLPLSGSREPPGGHCISSKIGTKPSYATGTGKGASQYVQTESTCYFFELSQLFCDMFVAFLQLFLSLNSFFTTDFWVFYQWTSFAEITTQRGARIQETHLDADRFLSLNRQESQKPMD